MEGPDLLTESSLEIKISEPGKSEMEEPDLLAESRPVG